MMYRNIRCSRWKILLAVVALVLFPACVSLALNCVQCHDSIHFKGTYEHEPVARNRCDSCHSLHASRHAGLLQQSEAQLCNGCHAEVTEAWSKSSYTHSPVHKGECTSCHAPHASAFKGLLKDQQKEVCAACHTSLSATQGKQHAPFKKGQCASCHAVHGSEHQGLLRSEDSKLCLGCHKTNSAWQQRHNGRKAQGMNCLECHHPHASTKKALLRPLQHKPFAAGNCSACHTGSSADGRCLSCHSQVLPQFQRVHTHLQGKGASNCTACHSPHVSSQVGLLKGIAGSVCRDCHADKLERRKQALYVHPQANHCSDCHAGHGSDEPYMLRGGMAGACESCHGEHSTFTHPIGDDVLDPRTGTPMDCISCHAPCTGTMFEHNLRGGRERGLCLPCHPGY
ncbi:MAG: cytochrome c3 family protein [Desulfuromonadaceae bacterium]|nr:cytochrome c3 family protein [Desulfuromonadaceae bacterium]